MSDKNPSVCYNEINNFTCKGRCKMGTANKKRIEETATTALKTALLKCPILDSYIDSNDKTPSWDGTVFVYKNDAQKKSDFIGKVPIQIKGTEKRIISNTASFLCSTVDLTNYYKDGGCIFFLVGVDPSTEKPKIFYSSMLVFDLQKLLKSAGTKKSITISLELFPEDSVDEMAHIFMTFVQNSHKQASFIGKELFSIEELQQQGTSIERLSFTASGIGINYTNLGKFVTTHSFYLYAKPKGLDIDIPVDKISHVCMNKPIDGKVCVKDIEHYSEYYIFYDNGKSTIRIGKGISLNLAEPGQKGTIRFKPTGSLSDFITDAEFFLDLMIQREISLNGANISFKDIDIPSKRIDQYKASLEYYKNVKKAFEILGVTEELQCDKLTPDDERNIKNFVNAVLYNREIGFPNATENTIYGLFRISNLSILIWATKQQSGYYSLDNFFARHPIVCFREDDAAKQNPLPASHFFLLDSSAFIHTSNMDYQRIYEDITSVDALPYYLESVTFLLLDMLKGYDHQDRKDPALLDLIDRLLVWMGSYESGETPEILTLNKLQVVRRKRALNTAETLELGKLIEDKYSSAIRCGAYLLLGETDKAQKCFDELDENSKDQFLKFPICTFGKLYH